ncbi:hypothetical protein EGQ50_02250 [Coxiella endosymbiont of Amblyomma sculptum]|uniref:Mth938-like domain-containing protein n=1 Tax=Coxiella endosymbiont of Amblyomma sculptum TaxID=2487929 RepID=UPI00132E7576|nr:Mth938-like domain-containing protein [Coxiella endosymbiont of Amblyomma sculptum]QHG92548.1 hypothetical protein EGQ50_02250 [Coxiella endosymbiont of Amblyomma sculptum]
MLLTENIGVGNYRIQSYDSKSVLINETLYTSSVVVFPSVLIENWGPKSLEDIKIRHFRSIFSLNPETIILGTGRKFSFLDPEKLELLLQQKIGIECMDTGAACRTYSALNSQGRRVAAALII